MQKYDFKQKFLAFTAIAQKYMATKKIINGKLSVQIPK